MSVRTRKISFLLLIVILELFYVDKYQVYAKRPSIDEFGFKNDTGESEFDGVYNLYRAKRAPNGVPAAGQARGNSQPARERITSETKFNFGIQRSSNGDVNFYKVNAPNEANGGACSVGESTNGVVPRIIEKGAYRESQMTSIPPKAIGLSDITSQAGPDGQSFDTRYTEYIDMKKQLKKVKAENASLQRVVEAASKVKSAKEEALKVEINDHNNTRRVLKETQEANAKLQKATLNKLADAQLVDELREVRKAHEKALQDLDTATEKAKSLADLKKDLDAANKINADLQGKIKAMTDQTRKEVESITAEIMKRNDAETAKLRGEISAYENETKQLKEHTAEVEANLAALKETHAQQKDATTSELRKVKAQFDSALTSANSRAEDAEAQLMEAIKILHSAIAYTEEDFKLIADMQVTLDNLNYEKYKLANKTQKLEADIIAAQKTESDLNNKISALSTAYADHLNQTRRRDIVTEENITGLMRQRDALITKCNSWESQYNQAMSAKAKCDAVPWWLIVIANWVCTVKLYIKTKANQAGTAAVNRMKGYRSAVSNKMVSFKDRAYSVMQAALAFFNSLPQRLARGSGRQAEIQKRVIMDLKVVIGGILVDAYHIHVYVRKEEEKEKLDDGLCYESVSLRDDLNSIRDLIWRNI